MRFSTGCAALALALFSSPALADRPFSWTGFYVGAHGGWAQSPIDPAGDYPLTGAPTQNVKGGFVGGQIGAQYQWGDWLVTGVEADISIAVPFGHCKPSNGFAPYDLTKTEMSTGWAYGGGFEFMPGPNWSIRIEAMRLEFDKTTYSLGKMANGVENPTKTFEHNIDVVRFAGNFKF